MKQHNIDGDFMLIKNAQLKNGIYDIRIDNGIISDIGIFDEPCDIDAEGKRVIPGLIDTHIHGFGGHDVSDFNLEAISVSLANSGTTTWFPTTMTNSIENLNKITLQNINVKGANIAGFHLEGPYISKAKKGAQNENFIKNPDIDELKSLNNIKNMTVAPELSGMFDFIKKADCHISIGHTCCSYDEAILAINAGADCLTHTFNAMPSILHRNVGPIGAAFEKGIYAELICDGLHVDKTAVLMLYKLFGSDRIIFISDCIRPAGLPNGKYSSGGIEVTMNDGVLTVHDGVLAGGSKPLLECVKTAVSFGIDFYEAVKMASETPAKRFGLNKGIIKKGYDADIVILNDDFTVSAVIIGGVVY